MSIKLLNILNHTIREQGGKFKDLIDAQGKRVGDTYGSVEMDSSGNITKVLKPGEKSSAGGGYVNVDSEFLINPSSKRGSPFNQVRGQNSQGVTILHKGIDYSVGVGTLVVVVSPGKVLRSGMDLDPNGYGALIEIEHDNGVISRYGHMSKIFVNSGDIVSAGTVIGETGGNSGDVGSGNSQGPHLHFEYRVGGTAIDPASSNNDDSIYRFMDKSNLTK